ncbi:MAG: hypothetical protein NZ533_03775 [Casimicrobiaceae bacterium]|nr:hypothetical protein [Casimicrobiaceae bacterium]MDW8312586.1 hypothetical protein [Burkholderiales bacterium]
MRIARQPNIASFLQPNSIRTRFTLSSNLRRKACFGGHIELKRLAFGGAQGSFCSSKERQCQRHHRAYCSQSRQHGNKAPEMLHRTASSSKKIALNELEKAKKIQR